VILNKGQLSIPSITFLSIWYITADGLPAFPSRSSPWECRLCEVPMMRKNRVSKSKFSILGMYGNLGYVCLLIPGIQQALRWEHAFQARMARMCYEGHDDAIIVARIQSVVQNALDSLRGENGPSLPERVENIILRLDGHGNTAKNKRPLTAHFSGNYNSFIMGA
jgi:hypothetical protein